MTATIDTDLRLLLASEPTISVWTDTRVFCERAEQGATEPYIVISDLSEDPLLALDGTYGLSFRDYDIDCYASSFPRAKLLANAVKVFLDDYTGAAGTSTIQAVLYQGQTGGYVDPEDGQRLGLFLTTLEFQIQYT
jgi:hypothetical protein